MKFCHYANRGLAIVFFASALSSFLSHSASSAESSAETDFLEPKQEIMSMEGVQPEKFEQGRHQCSMEKLSANLEAPMKEVVLLARTRDHQKTLTANEELTNVLNKMKECDSHFNCESLTGKKITTKLASGWTEDIIINPGDRTTSCLVSPEVALSHNDIKIRGIVMRDGSLLYTFPPTLCEPKELNIERKLQLTESGVLLYDYNNTKRFPGEFLFTKNKKSPSFSIEENGQITFRIGSDVYFTFDPEKKRIVESNFLDQKMFDPNICKSTITTKDDLVEVVFAPNYKQYYLSKLRLYGAGKEEAAKNALSKLQKRDN